MSDTVHSLARQLLLVDDHAVVREGLRRILESARPPWKVVAEGNAQRALQALQLTRFDLAVVDLSLPTMDGIELIRRIRRELPDLPVLVLSMHNEEAYAVRAFQAGANGYLTKDSDAEELLQAAAKVAAGGAFVSPDIAERVVRQLSMGNEAPAHTRLSERELDVLRRIVAGQRLVDIANALQLSIKTVSTHKTRILDKLKLDSTAALIRYGMESGLALDGLTDSAKVPRATTQT